MQSLAEFEQNHKHAQPFELHSNTPGTLPAAKKTRDNKKLSCSVQHQVRTTSIGRMSKNQVSFGRLSTVGVKYAGDGETCTTIVLVTSGGY